MGFRCPNCGSSCWGTGLGEGGVSIGCCQTSTITGVGGCGFRWQRSRNMDAKLGIEPVSGEIGVGVVDNDYVKCGTVDVKGFVKQQSLLRPAIRRLPEDCVMVFYEEPWGGAWIRDRGGAVFIAYVDVPRAEAEAAMKRAGLAAEITATPTAMEPSTFPVWPILVVGAIAVGIFAATLSIRRPRE